MSSQKSTPAIAREPQRLRGTLRVAALLKAGASVFAEKGYAAATMTEIAARAGAPIGSLYQFFPNKEALADALLKQYGEHVETAVGRIDAKAAELPFSELAAALLDLLVDLQEERAAAIVLIDARRASDGRPSEMRLAMRRHIARILRVKAPECPPALAGTMAVTVHHLMKAAAALSAETGVDARDAALAELHHMTTLYLADRLGGGGSVPPPRKQRMRRG
jgi:AcrR family transcriptional regulator